MAIGSRKIQTSVRLDNKLYKQFHEKVESQGQTKAKVIRRMIEEYVGGNCLTEDRKRGRS